MLAVQPIVDNLKSELWSFFSTEAHSNNAMIRYINSAIRDICIEKNFTFNKFTTTVTVTNNSTTYTIPNQIETFYVLDSEWTQIDFYPFEKYFILTDKSNKVWIWDETFECTTPWTYTVLYRGELDAVTSLSDSLNIPSRFFDAIVLWGLRYGYMDEKDYVMANEKKRQFDWLISSLATRNTNVYPTKEVRVWADYTF